MEHAVFGPFSQQNNNVGLKKILLTCQREYVLNLVAQNYELKIKTADKVSIHPTRRCKRDDALHYFVNAYQNYSNRIQPDAKKIHLVFVWRWFVHAR